MSVAEFAPPFDERPEPALAGSFALSVGMHLLLLALLLLGVNWQSREPEPVMVELWRAPSVPAPAPVVEPPPAPAPAPVPEPRIQKPDIALREAPRPKPVPKVERKPVERKPVERKPEPKVEAKAPPKAVVRPRDLEFERRLKEQLAHEQASIRSQRQEEEMKQLLVRQQTDAAAVRSKGLAAWKEKIGAKIKANVLVPQDINGNPEAIFDMVLLPSGDVISVKLRKSSGHRGYDDAVERAILKSSPLPKPDDPRDFQRQLELKSHPQDK